MSRLFLVLTLLIVVSGAQAEQAKVVALQSPAWLERGGVEQPLKPGAILEVGDTIRTGDLARVKMLLPEGSEVKLGSKAQFVIADSEPAGDGVFSGVYNILRGAFRFTTTTFSKPKQRRMNFNVGVITAGIRGTDIWGKAGSEKDLFCLIEGQVEVSSTGQAIQIMSEPETFYVVENGQAPNPIEPLPEGMLDKWVPNVEVIPGQGTLEEIGLYRVNLMSLKDPSIAEKYRNRYRAMGYPVEIDFANTNGLDWYRLQIHGFKDKQNALNFAKASRDVFGLSDNAWILR